MKKEELNKFKPAGRDAENYVILGVCPETKDAFGNSERKEWRKFAAPAEYFTQSNYHKTLAIFEPSLAALKGADEKGNVTVKELVAEISRPERASQFIIIHLPDFIKKQCEPEPEAIDAIEMPTIENTKKGK